MTDRMIVAIFDNTNAAYDAAGAIKRLKEAGEVDLELNAGAMVKKDDLGNVSVLETKDSPLRGTAIGTLTGALIGLLGGPAGASLGATVGATGGLTGDAVAAALRSDFVDSVTQQMRPGTTAIIVEADEKSTAPVDNIVAVGGGRVYRQAIEA